MAIKAPWIFDLFLEEWGGLWVVGLLEDVICCYSFSIFWCIFMFLSEVSNSYWVLQKLCFKEGHDIMIVGALL